MDQDLVVLIDADKNVLGTAPKLATHNANTPLHRGFSVFLFRSDGRLLLQQRSKEKKTWPLIWSNSCCGHPQLDEQPTDAARRRLLFELGIKNIKIKVILPEYRYRFEKDEIVENEHCPVMVALSNDLPLPNIHEVESFKYLTWTEWLEVIATHPTNFSPWAVEESQLLDKEYSFHQFLKEHSIGT